MVSKEINKALEKFNTEYIQFELFQKTFAAIEDNLMLYRQSGIHENLLILGESGCGKTTLCELIRHRYPRYELSERDVVPVLIIPVPASTSLIGIADEMLMLLGHPARVIGNLSTKTNALIKLIKGCGVEIILFDEAQHLHDRGKLKSHYLVGDWMKQLIDALKIPIVFLGLPRTDFLLMVNEQLRRRFSKKLYLSQEHHDIEKMGEQCLQMLLSLSQTFPVKISAGEFGWDEFGSRLYYATDARVAFIKKLMMCGLRYAMEMNLSEIGPADFEVIFKNEICWEAEGGLNPFNASFAFRRLDRAGELFAPGQGI